MYLIIYLWLFLLIFFSALFSGLTLGLFSLDTTELERKKELGDIRAEKVYRVRSIGNLLLVSLLLGNVAVNSGNLTISPPFSADSWAQIPTLVQLALVRAFGQGSRSARIAVTNS